VLAPLTHIPGRSSRTSRTAPRESSGFSYTRVETILASIVVAFMQIGTAHREESSENEFWESSENGFWGGF
jgi:hypothetical protein